MIIYNDTALIIESKFTLSSKQNKFNDAIVKAISQLNSAEQIIICRQESIDNHLVKSKLKNIKGVLKICIFHDDGRMLHKAFKNVKMKYDKNNLPIFISASALGQFMGFVQILNPNLVKENIIFNLIRLRFQYKELEIIVIDGFDINTGSISIIN